VGERKRATDAGDLLKGKKKPETQDRLSAKAGQTEMSRVRTRTKQGLRPKTETTKKKYMALLDVM